MSQPRDDRQGKFHGLLLLVLIGSEEPAADDELRIVLLDTLEEPVPPAYG